MEAAPAAKQATTLWQHVGTPAGRTALWRKYRRSILIGAGIAGVGALGAGTYWYWIHYREWREREEVLRLQVEVEGRRQREAEERAKQQEEAAREDAQLQTHFQSIQMIADSTTLPSIIPHLRTRLFALVDLTALTQALVASRGGEPLSNLQKMNIWEELKVLSFARALGSMWAVSLLFLFVRVQLNILGRHVYIHTAAEDNSRNYGATIGVGQEQLERLEQHQELSMSCQHKFIAFSDFLPHCGLSDLLRDVQASMAKGLQTKSLKDRFTLEQLWTLLRDLREEFEASHAAKWHAYLLPPRNVLPDDLAVASSAADVAVSGPASSTATSVTSEFDDPAVSTRGGAMADAMAGAYYAATSVDALDSLASGPAVGGNVAQGEATDSDSALDALMAETRLVLASPQFRQALSEAMDAVSDEAVKELAGTAFAQGAGAAQDQSPPPPSSIALAKLLPPVAAVAVAVLDVEESKALLRLSTAPSLTSFSALVYAGTIGSQYI